MKSRNLTKLSELINEISMGPFGSNIKVENFVSSGFPVLNGSNLVGTKLSESEFKYVKPEKALTYKKAIAKRGDIVITHRGTLGQISYIPSDSLYEGYVISQSQFRVRFNDEVVDPIFIVYYFHSKEGQQRLLANKCHVGVPALAQATTNFKLIEVPLPNISTQQKIGAVLSALDSKIELNNRINAELETMAKTLYDYWFVQFDFPNENGKPYKTSGGKMVWNEELKREIPKGWEVKEMNKLLTKNTAKFNFTDDKHDIDTLDLSVMPSATMCLNEKNSSSAFGTNLFNLSRFDILFGGIRPYLLKAGFSPFEGLVTGTVHSFRVKNENEYNFAILTMTHKSMFNFAVANSKGTKMPVIGADDLLTYKVAYNGEITKKFNECIQFRDIIAHNIIENQQLAELRDWLLPMLMNGQVKVK